MRWNVRSGLVSAVAAVGLCLGIAAAPADAAPFEIGIELGPQRTGNFGTMSLSASGVDTLFTILLNAATPADDPVLGEKATLNELYFNLPDEFGLEDLSLSGLACAGVTSSCTAELDEGRSVRGGAGADFDFSIHFDAGNAYIQQVSFVLEGVSLADVLDAAMNDPSATGRGLEVAFALHVTGGGPGAGHGSASATIGVDPTVVPEPGTALLFGLGVAGLAVGGRRARG